MRRLYRSLLLSAFVATAANATDPAYKDDLERHATFVGQMRVNHDVKPGEIIPEGTYIHYDSRLPAGMQLVPRVRGQMMAYTCPAKKGVKGLEEPRFMGEVPEFEITSNDTKIEVVRAAYDNQDMQPLSGFYRCLGIIKIASAIQNGSRVNTLRMICRSGVEDGLPLTIDYKETYHELMNVCDISQAAHPDSGLIHQVNKPHADNTPACFTFSCWYKSKGTTAHLAPKTLLELRIAAVEKTLKGQTKKLRLVVSNAADRPQLYVALQGSKDIKSEKNVKVGTRRLKVSDAVPAKYGTKQVMVTPRSTPMVILSGKEKHLANHGNLPGIFLMGDRKTGSYHRVVEAVYQTVEDETNIITPAKAAVYKEQDVVEARTFHDLCEYALVDWWVAKEGWMNFVMHVDATKKLATVFCNGQQVLCGATNFEYSLNGPFSWILAQKHEAQMADVHLIHGQLVPASSFCVRNSQKEVVPVKYTGQYGPRGFKNWN